MIAALMLYAIAISTLLAVAAGAAAYLLRLARRPTRFLWMGAMLAGPGLSLARFQSWTATASPPHAGTSALASAEADESARTGSTGLVRPDGEFPLAVFRAGGAVLARARGARVLIASGSTMTRLDAPLLVGWAALSSLGLMIIAFTALRLARPQPRWSNATVDGTPILLSAHLGPATIGLFRHRIVLPAWALELSLMERDLVLAHESEHVAAGDPALLFFTTVLLALTPWNAPLWWMARRLRFAIELDCDARVLRRRPDRTAYGALLLALSERIYGSALPIVGLTEPVSLIERRIAAMTSDLPPFVLPRKVAAGAFAAALIAAACEAPSPAKAPPVGRRTTIHGGRRD